MNQRFPSGPVAMPFGPEFGFGSVNSSKVPSGAARPIFPTFVSVNQTAPSGPSVMSRGPDPGVRTKYVMIPAVVSRPILS